MDDIAPKGAIGNHIRSRLVQPVIDGDGHAVELSAALPDNLTPIVGPEQTRHWTKLVSAPTVL